ncbi:MAG TPA: DUF2232 domain-containing protein [Thermopetrobacter sp.]|nr:DUF2232 domain-containing protein [Thermopetrobacter sp.]
MTAPFIIALAAGALSAVTWLALLAPTPLTVAMFLLSSTPLFMVGLAFGVTASLIAAAAGFALAALFAGPAGALFYLGATAAAPLLLTPLALISRPAAGGAEGEAADDAGREWYPEGRLLLWTAALAGALISLMLLSLGPDHAAITRQLHEMAGQVIARLGVQGDAARLKDFLAAAAPLFATIMWMLATLVSLWIAAKLVTAFGYRIRPFAPFARLAFHPRALLALAIAAGVSLLPGVIGLIGGIFATAFTTAFAILGLAVLHALTEGKPWRAAFLAIVYVGLFAVNWLLALPLALIGMAETAFGLRRRFGAAGGPPMKT